MATATQKWYRPGLVFQSRTSAHQEVCRSHSVARAMDGTIVSETRELLAEFAFHGGEYEYVDPLTGTTELAADIRGHFFDLDQQADEKEWTNEEKEIVARHMLRMAEKRPGGDFSLWTRPRLGPPWPAYDETDVAQIVTVAAATGLTAEAFAYESENLQRKPILNGLTELLEAAKAEEEFAAA